MRLVYIAHFRRLKLLTAGGTVHPLGGGKEFSALQLRPSYLQEKCGTITVQH